MRRERPGCDKGEWHWLTSASKARGGQQGGGEGVGGWLLWRPGRNFDPCRVYYLSTRPRCRYFWPERLNRGVLDQCRLRPAHGHLPALAQRQGRRLAPPSRLTGPPRAIQSHGKPRWAIWDDGLCCSLVCGLPLPWLNQVLIPAFCYNSEVLPQVLSDWSSPSPSS